MNEETARRENRAPQVPLQRSSSVVDRGEAAVAVGVDGSDGSVHALAWALRQASEQGSTVLVVTAWPSGRRAFVHEVPGHFNEARWEAREVQARAIARALSLVQDAPQVRAELVHAPALETILALCSPDRLVVLGTDRREQDSRIDVDSLTERARRAGRGPVQLIGTDA